MSLTDQILLELARTDGQVTSKIIYDLIKDHAPRREKMIELYHRYKGEKDGVPVLTRNFQDKNKINNKLANDFFGDIIDTKVGYFAGQAISYNLDKESDNYERNTEIISDFQTRNDIEDIDAETAKMAAIMGVEGRLCYIDRDGLERVMLVPGWECIWVTDISINEPQYALRYYTITQNDRERYRVEWYDDRMVTYFIGDKEGGFVREGQEFHLFDEIPLVAFVNNSEKQGDAEKVLTLIDGYDNAISDVNSEIEQFRLAYMAFYGVEIDEEMLERAKRTGAFGLPDDAKMEFVTKMLEDTIVEHHLDRLEDNIMRFAKSVNFADEKFAGTQSGVSLRYKMLALESKCITAERKFAAALRQMFRVLSTAWQKKGITIDPNDIFFEFKRNFPLNLLDEAETTSKLRGQVSEQTRLSLLSFVDNADYELELMEQENAGRVDLDMVEDEADEPTE